MKCLHYVHFTCIQHAPNSLWMGQGVCVEWGGCHSHGPLVASALMYDSVCCSHVKDDHGPALPSQFCWILLIEKRGREGRGRRGEGRGRGGVGRGRRGEGRGTAFMK